MFPDELNSPVQAPQAISLNIYRSLSWPMPSVVILMILVLLLGLYFQPSAAAQSANYSYSFRGLSDDSPGNSYSAQQPEGRLISFLTRISDFSESPWGSRLLLLSGVGILIGSFVRSSKVLLSSFALGAFLIFGRFPIAFLVISALLVAGYKILEKVNTGGPGLDSTVKKETTRTYDKMASEAGVEKRFLDSQSVRR